MPTTMAVPAKAAAAAAPPHPPPPPPPLSNLLAPAAVPPPPPQQFPNPAAAFRNALIYLAAVTIDLDFTDPATALSLRTPATTTTPDHTTTHRFVHTLTLRSQSTFTDVYLALFYLSRFRLARASTSPRPPRQTTPVAARTRIHFLACLVLAWKHLRDRTHANATWASLAGVAGVGVAELNAAEREVLAGLGYRLCVARSDRADLGGGASEFEGFCAAAVGLAEGMVAAGCFAGGVCIEKGRVPKMRLPSRVADRDGSSSASNAVRSSRPHPAVSESALRDAMISPSPSPPHPPPAPPTLHDLTTHILASLHSRTPAAADSLSPTHRLVRDAVDATDASCDELITALWFLGRFRAARRLNATTSTPSTPQHHHHRQPRLSPSTPPPPPPPEPPPPPTITTTTPTTTTTTPSTAPTTHFLAALRLAQKHLSSRARGPPATPAVAAAEREVLAGIGYRLHAGMGGFGDGDGGGGFERFWRATVALGVGIAVARVGAGGEVEVGEEEGEGGEVGVEGGQEDEVEEEGKVEEEVE
ncbi:hypothetical protein DFJ73DRAFT_914597 [Zopfochytrium polystomum]|nr:hypothetical protein DFJ73DRAFT_914597 [Zopfochytrium polystomum]